MTYAESFGRNPFERQRRDESATRVPDTYSTGRVNSNILPELATAGPENSRAQSETKTVVAYLEFPTLTGNSARDAKIANDFYKRAMRLM